MTVTYVSPSTFSRVVDVASSGFVSLSVKTICSHGVPSAVVAPACGNTQKFHCRCCFSGTGRQKTWSICEFDKVYSVLFVFGSINRISLFLESAESVMISSLSFFLAGTAKLTFLHSNDTAGFDIALCAVPLLVVAFGCVASSSLRFLDAGAGAACASPLTTALLCDDSTYFPMSSNNASNAPRYCCAACSIRATRFGSPWKAALTF